jgi:putative toxin-antitoxin system antitoxin component (TIGR02293 family)
LRSSGLTDEEIYSLVVPRRTLTHRRARREALSRDESDRVVRVARVLGLCVEVFGEPERGWRWLRAAKRQFRGRAPLDLLVTEAGARLVEELLYRIDEGMAA